MGPRDAAAVDALLAPMVSGQRVSSMTVLNGTPTVPVDVRAASASSRTNVTVRQLTADIRPLVSRGTPIGWLVTNRVAAQWTSASDGLAYRFFWRFVWTLAPDPDAGITAASVSIATEPDPELPVGPVTLKLGPSFANDAEADAWVHSQSALPSVQVGQAFCVVARIDALAGAHAFQWRRTTTGLIGRRVLLYGPVSGGPAQPPLGLRLCVPTPSAGTYEVRLETDGRQVAELNVQVRR